MAFRAWSRHVRYTLINVCYIMLLVTLMMMMIIIIVMWDVPLTTLSRVSRSKILHAARKWYHILSITTINYRCNCAQFSFMASSPVLKFPPNTRHEFRRAFSMPAHFTRHPPRLTSSAIDARSFHHERRAEHMAERLQKMQKNPNVAKWRHS